MPYNYYTSSEFVSEESFQAYVLCTDPEAVAFWTNWVAQNPQKEGEIQEATELIRLLTGPRRAFPLPDKQAELRRLIEQLPDSRLPVRVNQIRPLSLAASFSGFYTYATAAILALLLLAGGGWWVSSTLNHAG